MPSLFLSSEIGQQGHQLFPNHSRWPCYRELWVYLWPEAKVTWIEGSLQTSKNT